MADIKEIRTEADAVAEIALDNALKTIEANPAEIYLRITPKGHEVIDLGHYLAAPRRKQGTVTLEDTDSFGAYVNRHKTEGTQLYASLSTNTVTAVLNDHTAGMAGWGDHRAVLKLALTPEWQLWTKSDGKMLSQVDFAELIEQGVGEIHEPPAADMLDLAQNFKVNRMVAFEGGKSLQDGATRLTYHETLEASAGKKGQLDIPSEFKLGLAPYEGMDPYEVTVKLRYRLHEERLTIGYQMVRPADVVRAAFKDVLVAIEADTAIKPLLGSHSH